MKLKIVSNGTSTGTVLLTEDGQQIQNVTAITWMCVAGGVAKVRLTLINVPIEAEGDLVDSLGEVSELPPPPGARGVRESP